MNSPRTNVIRRTLRAMLVLALPTLLLAEDAGAQSGTLERRSVTFAATPTATISFGVQSLLIDPGASQTTIVQLEFGRDGSMSVVDPGIASVSFTLTRTVSGTPTSLPLFTVASLPSAVTTISGKEVTMARTDAVATPGLFTLTIVHTAATATAETWTLAMSSIPATTPPIRGIATIFGASTGFTALSPVGACGGGAAPTTCPVGEACRGPCPFCPIKPCSGPFRIYDIREFVWPRGPIPGPQCLSCPPEWRLEFDRNRYDRVIVTFVPTEKQRRGIERAKTKDILFNVTGGEVVGGPFEGSGGEFMQLVQYPKGNPPQVAVVAAGATLAQFRVDRPGTDPGSPYRDLLYGLVGLILGALGTLFGVRRGRGTGRGPAG